MSVAPDFFRRPILNTPYDYPSRHWELDEDGQPTQRVIEKRRPVRLITPIPKPRKRKGGAEQRQLVLGEGAGVSTEQQQYDPAPIVNELRRHVDLWRAIPNPADWRVTPETARLLQHWRHHEFAGFRPFFCQVEAVETLIWLTEVAPHSAQGKRFLEHLAAANEDASPADPLPRLALKLATGAGKTTVMAMVIAWQTINAARRRQSTRFTRGFLIVTPGITIRDRLRVLLPNDPDNSVDDGHREDDPLRRVVEIKGYRGEDARDKKATMERHWVPGVNNVGSFGRWAFAEFTDVYEIEGDFEARVEEAFAAMIDEVAGVAAGA